jgi:flagellar biosynthesis/type III secretory pathway M-ring protein FliF/YscJ
MEFASRHKCIEHYQSQFPNLPRYMVEMALDYDLSQGEGSASNEKPLTGKQKRQQKQQKKEQEPVKRELNQTIQDALETGKRIEIDCAQVVKAEDYEMPPFIKGHIEVDGVKLAAVAEQIQDEPEPEPLEEIAFDNDF